MQHPIAEWTLATRDEHPPAVADAPDPRIFHRRGPRHVGTEREPSCGWIEGIRATRFDRVDAPPLVDAIDVAHIEAPAAAVAKDRATLDRVTPEVLTRRAPDRFEALAVTPRDPELATAPRSGPAKAIDEINDVALTKSSGSAGPMSRTQTRWRFDQDRLARVKGRVHRGGQL